MKSLNKYKNLFISFLKYFILFFIKFYFLFIRVRKVKIPAKENLGSVCFYHQNILMLLKIASQYKDLKKVTLLSKHPDADILAFILKGFEFKVFRTDKLNFSPAIFRKFLKFIQANYTPVNTIDGPIGPNKEINYGALFLSKQFKLRVNVVLTKCAKYWQLSTWDRHIIPKPFTTIYFKMIPYKIILKEENSKKTLADFKNFLDKEEKKFEEEIK